MDNCTIDLSDTLFSYIGSVKTPGVIVKDGSTVLARDIDYSLSYSDGVLTVSGMGKYTSTISKSVTASASPFIWGQDNWSFDNTKKSFGDYSVNSKVFNLMKKDFALSDTQAYELTKNIEKFNADGFGGSCYGMTLSEIYVKQGDINLSNYGGYDTVNKNKSTSDMTSVINFIQDLQGVHGQCEILRESLFISRNSSQYDFIDKIESVLNQGERLVKISYGIKKHTLSTDTYSTGFHAVLGYGIEDCEYYSPITKQTYDKRVLIADPSYLAQSYLYNDSCIYYKSLDHSWIVPYNYIATSKYIRSCYWNADSGSETNTGKISSIMKYESTANTIDVMAPFTSDHYIAGLAIDNLSGNKTTVEQIKDTGDPKLEFFGNGSTGIELYDLDSDSDNDFDTVSDSDYQL